MPYSPECTQSQMLLRIQKNLAACRSDLDMLSQQKLSKPMANGLLLGTQHLTPHFSVSHIEVRSSGHMESTSQGSSQLSLPTSSLASSILTAPSADVSARGMTSSSLTSPHSVTSKWDGLTLVASTHQPQHLTLDTLQHQTLKRK